MVKFYTTNTTYDYPLPAVSFAYFLRYPNPYSTHVLSTDVISRTLDPVTQRLHTTRLHLKRSRIPPTILKLLPKSALGSSSNGEGQTFILEKSIIDVREGWMETESRNLEWASLLSVVERQRYDRYDPLLRPATALLPHSLTATTTATTASVATTPDGGGGGLMEKCKDEKTTVRTTVTFHSRFGQPKLLSSHLHRRKDPGSHDPDLDNDSNPPSLPKRSFFSSWSIAALQRTIEATGMQRTRNALVKSKDGMNLVLERLRLGGLVGVLEGMRQDRELVYGGSEGPWKRVWQQGARTGVVEEEKTRPRIRGQGFEDEEW